MAQATALLPPAIHSDGLANTLIWGQGGFHATKPRVRFLPSLVLTFAGIALTAPSALAREGGLALTYEAPAECPNRDSFWGQLWARSTRLQWTKPGDLAMTLGARISGGTLQYVGQLLLVDSTGAVVQREVAGPTCLDVSTALALITAVTLDALPTQFPTALSVPAIQKKTPRPLALGALVGFHTAVAPVAVPTVGLSGTFHDRQRFGSPELRLEALVSLDRDHRVYSDAGVSIGHARFLWMSSRTTACPLQVNLASTTLGPCVVVELGRLRGSGSDLTGNPRSKTGWWFAPGALLNWSLQTDPVWFRLAGGAVFPVVQDKFRFQQNPVAFQAHSLAGITEFEVAWAF